MEHKSKAKDILVVGFALFAMFFGAGNLIFPPFLGWSSASNWFSGFICFILIDVGLSIFAILVIAKVGKGPVGITEKLGNKFSVLILALNTICLGPLIAIPRTAATTFEFSVQPIFPVVNSWVFSILFFIVVIILSIKQSKAVDIIGFVLAPIMLIALFALILKGVVSPLGFPQARTPIATVVKDGILAGYQTMDMMGAIILSVAVTLSVVQKGYTEKKQQFKVIALAGVVCSVGLFSVYCGLAYLGASVSGKFASGSSRSELLISITHGLLGQSGILLLGIIVFTACITTAVGLLTSSASFFAELSNGKFKYEILVIAFAVFSCAVSTLGITKIISFAAPILDMIYPVLVTLIVLTAFDKYIKNINIYRFAAFGAFLAPVLTIMQNLFAANWGLNALPFSDYGFGWIVPTVVFGLIGCFFKNKLKSDL